jgi:hypothetical protein
MVRSDLFKNMVHPTARPLPLAAPSKTTVSDVVDAVGCQLSTIDRPMPFSALTSVDPHNTLLLSIL